MTLNCLTPVVPGVKAWTHEWAKGKWEARSNPCRLLCFCEEKNGAKKSDGRERPDKGAASDYG